MIVIEGQTSSGRQLARKLDYPTINVANINNYETGAFVIDNDRYGKGIAFVMPDLIEIHFLQEPDYKEDYIRCGVIEKILPSPGGILYYFYKGLEAEEYK